MSTALSVEVHQNLERLQHALTEWCIKEGYLGDAKFITAETWAARGEIYLTECLLVMVIDSSGLHSLLNLGCDTSEFDDLIESFGFWYSMGHSWSIGFEPIEGYDFRRLTGSYSAKLRDPRWKAKAQKVKERAGHACQDCGAKVALEAHHCYYLSMRHGFEPWEYPLSAFRALCRQCHDARDTTEVRVRAFAASLKRDELEKLVSSLDHARYWVEPEAIFDFLGKLGPSPEHIERAKPILVSGLKEPD